MLFEELRIKEVCSALHYTPNIKKWSAKDRKDHFVGIMLSGAAHHSFANQSFVLSRNCVYFFNQRDDYDVEVLEAGESFSVHFTTYGEIESDSFCVPVENPDEIIAQLKRAEQLTHASHSGDLALLATLYKLCDAISRARQKTYFRRDTRMSVAREYIDAHLCDRDCLREAVKQSGLTARRFGDLFKGNFGVTPSRYVTQRKIEQAKSMLDTHSLTVSEIAELCGFSDVYYFSKVFKQICGVPPSRWE